MTSISIFDVAIIGAGPAGSSCAAFCATAGLRTLLLERQEFPREKVCGDCLNPSCWPALERLQIADRIRALPHGRLRRVDFVPISGEAVCVELPGEGELAIKRSFFDQVLLERAHSLGAEVREKATLSALERREKIWRLTSDREIFEARALVAADGRNSTVARLLGLLPRGTKERVGLQTHCPLPPNFGERVVLQFLRGGYSGQAPVGDGELNLCLVARPNGLSTLKKWAESEFQLSPTQQWRTIAPLRRAAITPAHDGLFLVGDAARVVEPFTGEGIYYALRSGELAAEAITGRRGDYARAHEQLYRGRLWINRVARAAVLSPAVTSFLLRAGLFSGPLLRLLTNKITR